MALSCLVGSCLPVTFLEDVSQNCSTCTASVLGFAPPSLTVDAVASWPNGEDVFAGPVKHEKGAFAWTWCFIRLKFLELPYTLYLYLEASCEVVIALRRKFFGLRLPTHCDRPLQAGGVLSAAEQVSALLQPRTPRQGVGSK